MKSFLMDYKKFINLENYLADEVVSNFHNNHFLTGQEFFCIIIWKSNRSKSRIARLFDEFTTLDEGVKDLTSKIYQTKSNKNKMKYLLDFGFRLPIASAILSILYTDSFSIYDYRVCDVLKEELGTDKYHKIHNWTFENLWVGYREYLAEVLKLSGENNYRDADRTLWGKSFYCQLQLDYSNSFKTNFAD